MSGRAFDLKQRGIQGCIALFAFGALAASAGNDVVRTGNPAERGLTEDDFPRVQKLADGVYTYEALTGSPDDRYTANSLIVVSSAGVLVADGQGSPAETAGLVAAIARITEQPISHVVICSDHGDHTAGNSAFPATAAFIAHPNSKANLQRTANNPERAADAPPVVMPTLLVEESLSLTLGDTPIQILFLGRAHTGGDLFVWLPNEAILFTSEVFLNHMFSGYRSAYPSEWLDAMERAEKIGATTLLPGHGFIDDPEVLAEEWLAYKDHLRVVLDEVTRLHAAGRTVDEAIAEADFGIYAEWSGADFQGPIGVRRIYAELNGEL
jgi:glyoxylase-like metal-dependent hydrolase (beta-lactamase superfamily II)